MLVQLSPLQARIIGVMLEKERTTPDQYPMSLNAITTGCNQKSNREPVMALTESEVQDGLDELAEKRLVNQQSGFGSRVVKYTHRFCNTEFGDLKFNRQQLAIVTLLLLRGAQTPGELRTRSNRLADFANVVEVEQCLAQLQQHNGEQLVVKLDREPGKRESRYAQCFTTLPEETSSDGHVVSTAAAGSASDDAQQRIDALEARVAELEQKMSLLEQLLD